MYIMCVDLISPPPFLPSNSSPAPPTTFPCLKTPQNKRRTFLVLCFRKKNIQKWHILKIQVIQGKTGGSPCFQALLTKTQQKRGGRFLCIQPSTVEPPIMFIRVLNPRDDYTFHAFHLNDAYLINFQMTHPINLRPSPFPPEWAMCCLPADITENHESAPKQPRASMTFLHNARRGWTSQSSEHSCLLLRPHAGYHLSSAHS